MKGRLNLFQRTMLRWRELHPYSAVHLVRIPLPLHASQLKVRLAQQLESAGLTGLVLDPKHRWFRYEGGPANVELRTLEGRPDPLPVLYGEIERQLNAPFPVGSRINPFRFFTVDAGESFHLGLVYDHFIAGGDSIVLLMKSIVQRYSNEAITRPPAAALALYPPTYRRLLISHPVDTLRAMTSLPDLFATSRRSFRPRYARGHDPYNAFAHFRLDPSRFNALLRAAKAWELTVNDLCLAILLRALAPIAAERMHAPRRRELAVASIVNIRHDFEPGVQHVFGQFLASMRVSSPVSPGIGLEQLAKDVHAQTSRIKSRKLYLRTIGALALSGVVWPFLSPARRHRFYAKNYPVWGGVTLLNINTLWEAARQGEQQLPDYLRAVTTGPMAPLVLAITTVNDWMHVGVTFRTAAFSRAIVDEISDEFVRCIDGLEEQAA